MKMLLTKKSFRHISLLGFFVALFFIVPSFVDAQTAGAPCDAGSGPGSGQYSYIDGSLECLPHATTAKTSTSTPKKGAVKTSPFVCIESKLDIPVGLNILGCFSNITYISLNVFATLLIVAGVLLDTAIVYSTMAMSLFVNNIPGINVAWTVLRDLSNILILFVLLFAAVGIILRTDKIVPKNVLAKVIIAAFLINFSMFFTKVIIDIGNVATHQIYNEATSGQLIPSIGLKLASALNPMSAYIEGAINPKVKPANFETHIFQQMLFSTIIIMIATFTLFVAAIMLFHRFFTLIMLIVTSPIGIVGMLIPQLSGRAKEWWSTLIGQVFFAPIFLLFLLIAIKILNNTEFRQGLVSAGIIDGLPNVFDFTGGLIGMIQYMFVIGIILTGLSIAKAVAGKASAGVAKWASEKAGSIAFGGAAIAGSYGIGRFGKTLADSQFANKMMQSENLGTHLIGRTLVDSGKFIGNASFDVRGTGIGKELGAGKAAPGFLKREEETKKRRLEASKKVMPDDSTRFARQQIENDRTNEPAIDRAAREKLREVEAARNAEKGLSGLALVDAKIKTKAAEDALTPTDNRVIALKQDKWAEQDKRLAELEKLSVDVAKKREDEAKSEIAQLAEVLRTHEMQQAREIAKAINEKKEKPEEQKTLLNSLNENQQKFVQSLEKLSGAQKQLGDIQKAGQLAWADRNITANGSVGETSEAIRKEHSKTKASKILEDLIKENDKKEEVPKPETPQASTP